MKSLLCSSTFKYQKDILDHYLSYHNIDENNWFFQNLFQGRSKILLTNCLRCSEFLATEKEKAVHNFLKHYDDGKSIPFEEKPFDIERYPALTKYSIEFKKHSSFYNFYDSEKCVDDFLRNVKYRFQSSSKKWFKCSFIIENIQNSIRSDLQPLLNTRYWTTQTYDSTYFNDFSFFGLRQDILNRVLINTMSGSAWHFKRFISLAAKILDGEVEDFN